MIEENQLQLIVTEKSLGSLTTNAMQIRELVKSSLSRYDISNYNEDNISDAKSDKAMLNKASKALNSKRLEIEKEFLKPFAEFKEIVTETVKLIADCSAKIDNVVKESENKEKEQKRKLIEEYFNSLNFDVVPFEKLFKAEWLNKTTKEKAIFAELTETVEKIKNELIVIDSLKESTALKVFYLECLDLGATILYAERLKAVNELQNVSPGTQNAYPGAVQESPNELYTRSFKVTTTRENIIALSEFMNEKGIKFEKI